jgi:pilus assembly protein TadC
MDVLWIPPIRWSISLAVHAIILFLICHFAARSIRWSKLYKKLKDRMKVARSLSKKKEKKIVSLRVEPKEKKKKVGLSEFIRKARTRGSIRREYFIVLIPVVVAIMVVIFGAVFFVPGKNSNALRQTPFPTPLPSPSPTSESAEIEPQSMDENTIAMDKIIVIAGLIALAPYGFYVYMQKRRRIRYEREFARFLFELSELLRGGLDPVAGVIELASSATPEVYRRMESLAPHIDLLAKQLKWGMTFEEGMFELAKRFKSELIEKYTYLVVQASRIGGGIGDVILQCSTDMEKTFALEREKDAELREYILVIYIAQFILVAMLVMLQQMVIPALQSMSAASGAEAVAGFGFAISPVNIDFPRSFFHIMMINGFASGIIGGIMSEGDARQGIKHSVILAAVSFVVCLVFLI